MPQWTAAGIGHQQSLSCSELEVESEANGELLSLVALDDALEAEGSHKVSSQGLVVLVLEDGVNVGILINLELAVGGVIELVSDSKLGINLLGGPVVGKLGADSLAGGGGMAEVEPEFSEVQGLLLSSDVLDAELGTGSGGPDETELVVENLLALEINIEVSTEDIVLVKVRQGDHGVEGSNVGECLCLGLGVAVFSANLEGRNATEG